MNHSDTLTHMQRTPTRQRALVLLAALAVTLSAVAAPLAGTAHAGGSKPSIVVGLNAAAEVDAARGTPDIGGHHTAPKSGPGADPIVTGGSKPGIING